MVLFDRIILIAPWSFRPWLLHFGEYHRSNQSANFGSFFIQILEDLVLLQILLEDI